VPCLRRILPASWLGYVCCALHASTRAYREANLQAFRTHPRRVSSFRIIHNVLKLRDMDMERSLGALCHQQNDQRAAVPMTY
jgi:hypothetical protein